MDAGTTAKREPGASVKLMKPGPAMSERSISALVPSAATIASATSRGLRPTRLASCSATLVAKSPWSAFFGRSSSTSGASVSGKALATAARTSSARRAFESGEGTRERSDPNRPLYGARVPGPGRAGAGATPPGDRRRATSARAARRGASRAAFQSRRNGCSAPRARARTSSCARSKPALRSSGAGTGSKTSTRDESARGARAPRTLRNAVASPAFFDSARSSARWAKGGNPATRRSSSASAANARVVVRAPRPRRADGRESPSGSALRPGAARARRARRPARAARSRRSAARKSALKSALSLSSTPTSVRLRIVVALGEHLRADEDVDLAGAHALEHARAGRPCARGGVAIDARDARSGKRRLQRFLDALRAVADGRQVGRAAVRDSAPAIALALAAVVAAQLARAPVQDQVRAAARCRSSASRRRGRRAPANSRGGSRTRGDCSPRASAARAAPAGARR